MSIRNHGALAAALEQDGHNVKAVIENALPSAGLMR
jgi:hypothetical protein